MSDITGCVFVGVLQRGRGVKTCEVCQNNNYHFRLTTFEIKYKLCFRNRKTVCILFCNHNHRTSGYR